MNKFHDLKLFLDAITVYSFRALNPFTQHCNHSDSINRFQNGPKVSWKPLETSQPFRFLWRECRSGKFFACLSQKKPHLVTRFSLCNLQIDPTSFPPSFYSCRVLLHVYAVQNFPEIAFVTPSENTCREFSNAPYKNNTSGINFKWSLPEVKGCDC